MSFEIANDMLILAAEILSRCSRNIYPVDVLCISIAINSYPTGMPVTKNI
jgi:hypothetical protein